MKSKKNPVSFSERIASNAVIGAGAVACLPALVAAADVAAVSGVGLFIAAHQSYAPVEMLRFLTYIPELASEIAPRAFSESMTKVADLGYQIPLYLMSSSIAVALMEKISGSAFTKFSVGTALRSTAARVMGHAPKPEPHKAHRPQPRQSSQRAPSSPIFEYRPGRD